MQKRDLTCSWGKQLGMISKIMTMTMTPKVQRRTTKTMINTKRRKRKRSTSTKNNWQNNYWYSLVCNISCNCKRNVLLWFLNAYFSESDNKLELEPVPETEPVCDNDNEVCDNEGGGKKKKKKKDKKREDRDEEDME